jgi:NitT/TauT family transport system ATP-binding protein
MSLVASLSNSTVAAPPRGRLALQAITKTFNGSDIHVLENIDLICEAGEFVVVVGPSGSGKSTLLSIAAGMIKPDRGTATLDGEKFAGPSPDRAMVFQDHGLFPWLSAAENIEFGLKMSGMSKSQRRDRVAEALASVHLINSGEKLVHELSGGMRQRVAIARALVMNPAVLLMDEPFAALDAQTRTLLHAQLQELWCQTHKTILFVTHSVGEAVRLADRIIVLSAHPGKVRREVKVRLPHPRNFDSPEIGQLVHLVRREIQEEVDRDNAQQAGDFWKPVAPVASSGESSGFGDGI